MKHGILGLTVLVFCSCLGCVCSPSGTIANPCGSIPCTIGPGVVDYVDGGSCAGDAPCGGCGYVRDGQCGQCLGRLGNGIGVVGGAALDLVAAPVVLASKIVAGGSCVYETYPNCGCSNEVYYGDNSLQAHDFCDPCGTVGGGTVGFAASSGCSSCNGGFTEGIQSNGIQMESVPMIESVPENFVSPQAVPTIKPTVQPQPVSNRTARPQNVVFAHPKTTGTMPQTHIITASADIPTQPAQKLVPPRKMYAVR